MKVRDQMRVDQLPFVAPDATMRDAILVMTEGRLGLALVGDASCLDGIITDGDLRRLMVEGGDLATITAGSVVSDQPLTIGPDQPMAEAEARMQENRVQCLVVTGEDGHVEGVVQIYE
jgi:arabinose-5-phosphate isomerase